MASRGKNVNLFFMDGTPTGRIKCTLANWTGVVYKLPRTTIDQCRERQDLKQSGVYLLLGTDEEDSRPVVYIGQAGNRKNGEGILNRLQEHRRNPEKDYWTEAVVFTTSNNSFGPTEISYLENRFCNLAVMANRCRVKNGNDPSPGNLTEEKESELEEFIYFAKFAVAALGYRIFEPLVSNRPEETKQEPSEAELTLYLDRKPGLKATCKRTAEGYVLLKGSKIRQKLSSSFPKGLRSLRAAAKVTEDGILLEDYLFSSPSAAGSFVTGASLNGLTAWLDEEGRSLKDLEAAE